MSVTANFDANDEPIRPGTTGELYVGSLEGTDDAIYVEGEQIADGIPKGEDGDYESSRYSVTIPQDVGDFLTWRVGDESFWAPVNAGATYILNERGTPEDYEKPRLSNVGVPAGATLPPGGTVQVDAHVQNVQVPLSVDFEWYLGDYRVKETTEEMQTWVGHLDTNETVTLTHSDVADAGIGPGTYQIGVVMHAGDVTSTLRGGTITVTGTGSTTARPSWPGASSSGPLTDSVAGAVDSAPKRGAPGGPENTVANEQAAYRDVAKNENGAPLESPDPSTYRELARWDWVPDAVPSSGRRAAGILAAGVVVLAVAGASVAGGGDS